MGETFASCTSDNSLITRIYRKLKKLNSQGINDPMKKLVNELTEIFQKKRSKWQKKIPHMNKCSTS
jgi:hypothetical protein